MNKNDYRRALVMLRSLRTGVSGYVRLERRTLMGTLQFTVNGAPADGELYAILLYNQGGTWRGVKLGAFAAPRYGQTGLLWKFDPRNIEGRTLEQYNLTAVVEIRSGICELILCGNLNGSVDADWTQVRDAACRLFTSVRISGTPIPPIDDSPDDHKDHQKMQTDIHEESITDSQEEQTADQPGNSQKNTDGGLQQETTEQEEKSLLHTSQADQKNSVTESTPPPDKDMNISCDPPDAAVPMPLPAEESLTDQYNPDQQGEMDHPPQDEPMPSQYLVERDEFDLPARDISDGPEYIVEPDEFDTPAMESSFLSEASFEPDEFDIPATDDYSVSEAEIEADEFDLPAYGPSEAQDEPEDSKEDESGESEYVCAGKLLCLKDPSASWPACIEALRPLFFSCNAEKPFEAPGYTFIRAPLPGETGPGYCYVGLFCEDGVPARVCYAIPSPYSSEPPAGLEGYVWRGDAANGCWAICEAVTPDLT